MRRTCGQVFGQPFEESRLCYSLSEQFLLLSLSQGFAILPMPEGDVYPGLSVIPLDDDFTEYAVLAYRPDSMTEELQKFYPFFPGCQSSLRATPPRMQAAPSHCRDVRFSLRMRADRARAVKGSR